MGTVRNAPVLPELPELKEMYCAIETGQFFIFSPQMPRSLNQNLTVLQNVERINYMSKMDIRF